MDAWGIAFFGVAATLAGAVLNHWLSVGRMEREREAGVRERWREQAFSVLGPLGTWLTDADSDGLGFSANSEGSPEVFAELWRECNEMRVKLATLAMGLPTERGRQLAGNLEVAIFKSLRSTEWFVHELLAHRSTMDYRERAKLEHDKAVELRDALAEEVRSLS